MEYTSELCIQFVSIPLKWFQVFQLHFNTNNNIILNMIIEEMLFSLALITKLKAIKQ